MKITVLPEYAAKAYSYNEDLNKCIFISITCPDAEDVHFFNNDNLIAIFNMKFNDIDNSDWFVDGKKLESPKLEDFKGLKNFLDEHIDDSIEEIVVHCGAGVSRSAGVALAIAEYLNIPNDIATSKNYCPNLWVNKLAKQELGIFKDEDFYKKIFEAK